MMQIDPRLKRWWDWYSQSLSLARAANEWTWIERIANETGLQNPVISAQASYQNALTAGFCVLLAGGLAAQGGFTQRPHHGTYQLSDLRMDSNHPDTIPQCIERLIIESFERNVELYQALIPIESNFIEKQDISPEHCRRAGMFYLTKLIRMEKHLTRPNPNSIAAKPPPKLTITPYQQIPLDQWTDLLEQTYVDSKDVPEVTTLRSTQNTLRGYMANRTPGVETWFVVHCHGKPAGCLILSRHYHPAGEISYLGLAPSFRSQGYSFGIMQFAIDWMAKQKCTKVALAVDCRNQVAMNVYQKWGFQATISYHAWVASPKTFQFPNDYSST